MTSTGKSKFLSWLLRHGAGKEKLVMSADGWSKMNDICACTELSREEIEHVIQHNNKSRFERNGEYIRASQGHSIENMPITRSALESSWELYLDIQSVWHGTNLNALEGIATSGILSGNRTHVHLSKSTTSITGKRQHVAVMLEISPKKLHHHNIQLFITSNEVILARHIPLECIINIKTITKRAKRQQKYIQSLFPSLF